MSYLAIFVLLNLLILVHELGHLLVARCVGIPVAGFSVGLGPKLWSRRHRGTEYCIRSVPLGGFVMPAIEDGAAFRGVSLARRIAFFLGGPAANVAACIPLFAALNTVRDGISLHGLLVAPFLQTAETVWQVLLMVPAAFSQPAAVTGVVGIVVEGGRLIGTGMGLEVAILLSASVAIFNLLPIPVLDGGQIVQGCLEEAWPSMIRWRLPLTAAGLFVLAVVMIYVNVQDVVRYWG